VADHETPPPTSFEDYPLTRHEYINAVVHFYRGERTRTDAWRARLDPTTNWAVATTGGILSIAFGSADHSHVTLLLAIPLVLMFLGFEARRFRYFDVWRARVRLIEENFFIPIFRRNLVSKQTEWREWVAQDLDQPTFKLTVLEAVAIRLRFNYVWILLVILVAWLAKLTMHPFEARSATEVFQRMAIGPIPAAAVLVAVIAVYAALGWLAVGVGRHTRGTDEIYGLEKSLDHWKT
jgi:uncharacterized membrane protein